MALIVEFLFLFLILIFSLPYFPYLFSLSLLSLRLPQYGFPIVEQFLAGAHAMDTHFFETPLRQNLPVLMGLLGVWNSSFLGHSARAILPCMYWSDVHGASLHTLRYNHCCTLCCTPHVQHLPTHTNTTTLIIVCLIFPWCRCSSSCTICCSHPASGHGE